VVGRYRCHIEEGGVGSCYRFAELLLILRETKRDIIFPYQSL
jgi:hypothetical protein